MSMPSTNCLQSALTLTPKVERPNPGSYLVRARIPVVRLAPPSPTSLKLGTVGTVLASVMH